MISNFFFGLGSYFTGFFENKYGEKKLLLLFQIGSFFSCLFIIFSKNIITFAISHIVLCVFMSIYHPAGLTLISRRVNFISKGMSYHGVAGSFGLAFGPFLSSTLASHFSWRYAYIFIMIIFLFLFIYTYFFLESKSLIQKKIKKNNLLNKYNNIKLIIYYIITCLIGIAFSSILTYMPYFFSEKLINSNYLSVLIGGYATSLVLLAGIPGQLIGGIIGEKFNKSLIILILCLLHVPLLIIIPLLDGYFLICFSLLLGLINFTYQPIGNSIVADYTLSDQRGFAYGLSFFLSFGVGSIGAGIGGLIISTWNISLVFYFSALIMLVSIIPSFLLWIKD